MSLGKKRGHFQHWICFMLGEVPQKIHNLRVNTIGDLERMDVNIL